MALVVAAVATTSACHYEGCLTCECTQDADCPQSEPQVCNREIGICESRPTTCDVQKDCADFTRCDVDVGVCTEVDACRSQDECDAEFFCDVSERLCVRDTCETDEDCEHDEARFCTTSGICSSLEIGA